MKKLNLLKAKAELFRQLAVMEAAGMPLHQAVQSQLLSANAELTPMLSRVCAELKAGRPFAVAGASAGLFTDMDTLMIQAATDGGKLEQILKRLAEHYALYHGLAMQMQAKMTLPVVVFVLAVFIAPIASLVTGTLDAGGYLHATVFFLLKVALFCYVLMRLPGALKTGRLRGLGLGGAVDALWLKLPLVGRLCVQHELVRFFENLGLLLQAGIPVFDALPKSVNTLGNTKLQQSFYPVMIRLKNQSATLTEALLGNQYMTDEAIEFVRSGEQAGRLDTSLIHYGKLARAEVNASIQQLAAWIPRIIYGMICLYMIHAIFASNAFLSPPIDSP